MNKIYLKEDDYSDIDRIDDYNNEYLSVYPDFVPFATRNNFKKFLEDVEKKKHGIGNNGVCEYYYFLIEDDKIGSIRTNPEVDEITNLYSGHIMYGIVPSKRRQGYGEILCKLLLLKMHEMGFNKAIITCNKNNIGSSKIIEKNGGKLLEILNGDGETFENRTKRYVVDINELFGKGKNKLK